MKQGKKHIENYMLYYYGTEDKSIVVSVGIGTKGRAQQKRNNFRKDAGKHFLSTIIENSTNKEINLYSKEISKINAREIEFNLKNDLCNGFEMNINGNYFKKQTFYDNILIPQVIEKFGKNSNEALLIEMIALDGDSLVSMRQGKAEKIINNILKIRYNLDSK